jgi:hypothetical protein
VLRALDFGFAQIRPSNLGTFSLLPFLTTGKQPPEPNYLLVTPRLSDYPEIENNRVAGRVPEGLGVHRLRLIPGSQHSLTGESSCGILVT